MKRIKQLSIWIIALAGWMITTGAVQAKDFDIEHYGLFYKITKQINPITFEVMVVPQNANSPYYSPGNKPTGAVAIPSSFLRNSRIYKVTEIGDNAFRGCFDLTSVTIPDGITRIGAWAFFACEITTVTIPGSVKTIGREAFLSCLYMKSVTLLNGIQEIGEGAFENCKALQSIDIPGSVTTIRKIAFWDCTGLKTVTVHWKKPLAVPDNTFGRINTANVTLNVPEGTKGAYQAAPVWKDFKVDDGTEANYDFKRGGLYYKIIKNTGPSSAEVRIVPENSSFPFYSGGMNPAGKVTISSFFPFGLPPHTMLYTVKEIGVSAFSGCSDITSLTLLEGIEKIDEWAFSVCDGLPSIEIPSSVKHIGRWAFSRCTELKTVTVHWNKPLAVPDNIFENVDTKKITLKVPKGTKEAYKNANVWKDFKIDDGTPDVVLVTGVTLAPNSLTLEVGQTGTLTATVQPATATNKAVTWTSSAPAIATIDASGKVKGVSTGTATITVKTVDGGKTATCAVTVKATTVPVSSVTLNHHKVTVNADITQKQLTATVKPAAATDKTVTWVSNNPAVASVDADGLVTIHKKGQATVTATANDGSGHSDACLFDVISTVANETIDGLRVYAAGGALHLTLPRPETVQIYHIGGALVKTLAPGPGDHIVPLPAGIYVVRVGERVTKIFVK
ncbi:leucine-rich repeat protein [Tannerella forsythia]|uniref:Ig-like domain-containing protein n=1 Tax=Tannerella forsythia TaxID=28112 RepID=A0A3P1XLQ3_TANFO|nr:leucine-rich repeat protein [Tannerella forsythia]RRD59709.1 hypothetical protein EII40_09090 [Tannerella forsythia]